MHYTTVNTIFTLPLGKVQSTAICLPTHVSKTMRLFSVHVTPGVAESSSDDIMYFGFEDDVILRIA